MLNRFIHTSSVASCLFSAIFGYIAVSRRGRVNWLCEELMAVVWLYYGNVNMNIARRVVLLWKYCSNEVPEV